jgi:hypothetical protein
MSTDVLKVVNPKEYNSKTILAYTANINRLSNYDICITSLPPLCEIMSKLSLKLKDSTIVEYLSAIKWYSLQHNINLDRLSEISEKISSIIRSDKLLRAQNSMTPENKVRYTSWSVILEVHSRLNCVRNLVTPDLSVDKKYLILSLYVLMPPRRVMDYEELYYDNSQIVDFSRLILYGEMNHIIERVPKTDEFIELDKRNYYVNLGEKGYFIFNNYKTRETYLTQYLELNPELHNYLKYYVSVHKVNEGESILNITGNNLIHKLCKVFKDYTNKPITVNDLRHIYISHVISTNQVYKKTAHHQLANQMAHSLDTQMDYKKSIDISELDTTLNDDATILSTSKRGNRVKYQTLEEKKRGKLERNKISYEKMKESRKLKSLSVAL